MTRIRLAGTALIAWAAACGTSNIESNGRQSGTSSGGDAAADTGPLADAAPTVDAADAGIEEPCDAGMECPLGCRAGRCLVLTPSNLPADICDTPGTKDFTGGLLENKADFRVPQVGGPDIIVFKFANVSGDIDRLRGFVTAVVATHSMRLGSAPSSPGSNFALGPGTGSQEHNSLCGAGGSGHATPGGGPHAGKPYGSETGIPLLPGSQGSFARAVFEEGTSPGGYAGSGLQLVSCGPLTITGEVGTDGFNAENTSRFTSGAGGGSGGTLLIEAASVSTGSGSVLTSNGGDGMGGYDGNVLVLSGKGGTAHSPPGGTTCGTGEPVPSFPGRYMNGAGGGGAVGRIRINVRAGTQPELLGSVSPVPSMGAVATH